MSSFGFHGKVPEDGLSGGKKKSRGKRSGSGMDLKPPKIGFQQNNNNMNGNGGGAGQPMYNGMYNMPPIQPQPVNGVGGGNGNGGNRRMTRGNQRAGPGMSGMSGMSTPTPVNSYINSVPPPQMSQSSHDSIAMWKSQRQGQGQGQGQNQNQQGFNNQNGMNGMNGMNNQSQNQNGVNPQNGMNGVNGVNGVNGINSINTMNAGNSLSTQFASQSSNNIPSIPHLNNQTVNTNNNLPQISRLPNNVSGLGAIDVPSFDAENNNNRQLGNTMMEAFMANISRLVEVCRQEISELKHSLEVTGQLDPTSTLNTMQKHIQQMATDHNLLKEHIRKLETLIKNQQLQFDERYRQEELRREQNPAESLEQFSVSVNQQFQKFGEDVQQAIRKVSEQGHFVYGRALDDHVSIFDSPDFKSREVGSLRNDEKLLLNYPMLQKKDGVWMSGRIVGGDGQITKGYVPIWVYPSHVVDQFYPLAADKHNAQTYDKIPPQYRQTYVGKFEL